VEKSRPNIWGISAIFKKLPKENNHPVGEISPNLVTLLASFYLLHALWHGRPLYVEYICTVADF
jgi:hypothetical protein